VDLSQATFVHPQTEISICAVLGGVKVILPPGVRSEVCGVSVLGRVGKATCSDLDDVYDENVPVVKLRGVVVLGAGTLRTNFRVPKLVVVE
jgi:hypothetical protein